MLKAQPDHATAPLLLADCRLQLGEWKQVIAMLDPLLEKDPENQAILYMIGTALMRDRQYERGQRVLDRILRRGDSAEAHLVLAIASREAKDDIAAEKELRRALELNPALPTANGTLGEVLAKMGDAPGAVEALRRELAINPNHFDSHVLLGPAAAARTRETTRPASTCRRPSPCGRATPARSTSSRSSRSRPAGSSRRARRSSPW